ncbi:aspartate dehydrogenase [Kitasatospora purpeofusca]|uniref:aspartate dehydrogenase n=1 Tax=Kitasatospora purpeofusca TaxID=67352 RepID=UPI0033F69C73
MPSNPAKLPRLGFIGFGAIGRTAFRALRGLPSEVHQPDEFLAGILLRRGSNGSHDSGLEEGKFVTNAEDLVARRPELVVECAGHEALKQYGPEVLGAGIDLLIVSSGALADTALLDELSATARSRGSKLLIAPGAIGGLDWLSAAAIAGLDKVVYKSRKPPQAWAGTEAPTAVEEATVFYSSSVRDAALRFPKNVNAAVTVALSGIGLDDTKLELISDPNIAENIHEIYAEGAAGILDLRLRNAAEPGNPKTSLISGFSVAQCIRRRSLTAVT